MAGEAQRRSFRHDFLQNQEKYSHNQGIVDYELWCVRRKGRGCRQNSGNHSTFTQTYYPMKHILHSLNRGRNMCQVYLCRSNSHVGWPNLLVLQFGLPCKPLFPQALESTQALLVRNRMLLPRGHRLHLLCRHPAVIIVEDCHCSFLCRFFVQSYPFFAYLPNFFILFCSFPNFFVSFAYWLWKRQIIR